MGPGSEMFLSTSRLYLRPIDPTADAPDVFRMSSNRNVSKFLSPPSPTQTLSSVHSRLSSTSASNAFLLAITIRPTPAFPPNLLTPAHPNPKPWAAHAPPPSSSADFIDRSSQSVVGTVGVTLIGEVGFTIDEPWWGMGLATEALGAVVKAWEGDCRGRLRVVLNAANVGARRVVEKVGFVKVGEKEANDWDGKGKVRLEVWERG